MHNQAIPAGLRTDKPPEDGRQIVAWAIDMHAYGINQRELHPRWVITQFASDYDGGKRYWRWAVRGYVTSVRVIAWMELPCDDIFGGFARRSIAP